MLSRSTPTGAESACVFRYSRVPSAIRVLNTHQAVNVGEGEIHETESG